MGSLDDCRYCGDTRGTDRQNHLGYLRDLRLINDRVGDRDFLIPLLNVLSVIRYLQDYYGS